MKIIIILQFAISALLISTSHGLSLSQLEDAQARFDALEREEVGHVHDYEHVTEEPDVDEDVKNCFIKVLTRSVTCIMKSMTYWDISPLDLKTEINSIPTCCAIWEMTDCMTSTAKLYCNSNENIAFSKHMNELTEKRNINNCSEIPYQSDICNAQYKPQTITKNPVINKLLYRRGNQLITQEQLSHELKPNYNTGTLKFEQQSPSLSDQPIGNMGANMLDELNLAEKLLDRIDRITINQMVIDLHPLPKQQSEKVPETTEVVNSIEVEEPKFNDQHLTEYA